jgi:hypothetical protein
MQEASLLNITNQACGLFSEAEVGHLWTRIAFGMHKKGSLVHIAFGMHLASDFFRSCS